MQQNMGGCEQDGKQTHIEEDINIIFEVTTSSPRLMYNNQVKKRNMAAGRVTISYFCFLETYTIHFLKIKTLIFSLSRKHRI
jgi:hypothetical protein